MRFAAILVLAVVLFGISLALLESGADRETREVGAPPTQPSLVGHSPTSETAETTTVPEGTVAGIERTASEPLSKIASGERVPVQGVALSATVTTTSGDPIQGAEASWISVPSELSPNRSAWSEFVSGQQATRTSDEDGKIVFESPPDGAETMRSVVWVTHTDFGPESIELEPLGLLAITDHTLVLEPRPRVTVAVVDGLDQPIAEAEVVQWGLGTGDHDSPEVDPARLIVRRSITGPSGRVAIAHLPGREEITAHSTVGASAPWVGVADSDLQLTIGSAFFVTGSLRRASDLDPTIEATIDCYALFGHRRQHLASITGVTGDWGPLELPVTAADSYLFSLDGPGLIPFDATLRSPKPGENHTVELEAKWGQTLWILCSDENREVLKESKAKVEWVRDGLTTSTTFSAREDGYIHVEGLPEGLVTPILSCPGYETLKASPILLPEEDPVAHEFELSPAAIVSGRVLADGEPVSDFTVSVWPTGTPSLRIEQTFTEQSDGAFELKDVEAGEVVLLASSIGIGTSAPIPLSLKSRARRDVTIELPTGVRATGVIIDALTRVPIAGASIRAHAADGRATTAPIGRVVFSASDGSFEIDGLPLGTAAILATAEGYGTAELYVQTLEAEPTLLGAIPLARRQDLTVRALHSDPTDFAAYTVVVSGFEPAGPENLDSEGVVVFEDLGAGSYTIGVTTNEGAVLWKQVTFVPGTEWSVEFDLRGSCEVRAEIVRQEGEELPPSTSIWLTAARTGPLDGRSSFIDGQAGASFTHLLPGLYQVEAREFSESGQSVLAAQTVELDEGDSKTILLDPTRDWPVLRVIDPEGRPVSQVSLYIAVPGLVDQWSNDARTDQQGLFELAGLDADQIVVGMSHATLGHRVGVEVDTRTVGEPIDLVLDASASAEFVLRHPDGPAGGVMVFLVDEWFYSGVPGSYTDENGVVRFNRIAEGNYLLYLNHPGYFFLQEPVVVAKGGAPASISVTRLAELEVLTATNGLPRPHVDIELVRIENGSRVADYLAQGLVKSSSGEMRTGPDGSLRLTGMPEGQYSWKASESGSTVEGVVLISPSSGIALRIEIP